MIETIPAVSFHEAKIKIAEAYNRPIRDWEDFEPDEEKILSEIIFRETRSELFLLHIFRAQRGHFTLWTVKKILMKQKVSTYCLEGLKLQLVAKESIIMKKDCKNE
ncbi:hypothetical protein K040078D81_01470 [Blautia hominis]|uniref:Uncharacterized protein n=1 Tax=Blautia hominis TaxID=2025493 RepID=A0ABQ0B3J6_9FIRM